VTGATLPRGTVTFVFTDIEGSTRLLQRLGSEYGGVLQRQRSILDEAITNHGGIVFGTEGDAVFAAFERASSAVAAAVDAQLALKAATWPDDTDVRVRIGIHTGEADVVNGDYVGLALHVAARVTAAGHGGQVLITEACHGLASDVAAADLGVHRLKDVGDVRVLQLTHPDLPEQFPPLRSLSACPNNLPASVDSFVGRSAEVTALLSSLENSRLVTLTGAGGTGKTRLALEVGSEALPSYRDGVWFVPLAAASDGSRVVPMIAEVLHVAEQRDEPLTSSVVSWLRERELLLLLDNCEHVVASVAEFVETALASLPHLKVLATSRQTLGVRGEHTVAVPPLPVSDDDELSGVSDAVELFLLRASAAAPQFDTERADLATIGQICSRLDGLPLAIELAASRLRTLSLDQLARRLDDRFRMLSGVRRPEHAAQHTLEEVVAWSYELLTEQERVVFTRASVFPAHFELEAAEAVVSGDGIDEVDVLDVLTHLVDKSLITTVVHGDGVAFQMLETLRQFAAARLADARDVDRWSARLLDWAMTRVASVESALRTPAQDAALRSAIGDAVAVRAAMQWAIEAGRTLDALRIAAAIPIALNGERRAIIATLLEQVGGEADDVLLGRAYSALGNMAFEQSDWSASRAASEAARRHFLAADAPRHAGWAAYLAAHAAWGAGELEQVDELIEETVTLFREEGDTMGLGYALWVSSLRTSDLSQAQAQAAEADLLLRGEGATMGIAHNVEGRGIIAYERSELVDAAGFISEAVELFSSYGNLGCSAHAIEAAAVVVSHAGRGEVAVELLEAAEQLRTRSGQGHRPWEIRARHGDIEGNVPPLAASDRSAALALGRRHTLRSAAQAAIAALGAIGKRNERSLLLLDDRDRREGSG